MLHRVPLQPCCLVHLLCLEHHRNLSYKRIFFFLFPQHLEVQNLDTPIYKEIIESQHIMFSGGFSSSSANCWISFCLCLEKRMSKYKLCLLWAEPSRNIQQAVQSSSYTMHLSTKSLETALGIKIWRTESKDRKAIETNLYL